LYEIITLKNKSQTGIETSDRDAFSAKRKRFDIIERTRYKTHKIQQKLIKTKEYLKRNAKINKFNAFLIFDIFIDFNIFVSKTRFHSHFINSIFYQSFRNFIFEKKVQKLISSSLKFFSSIYFRKEPFI